MKPVRLLALLDALRSSYWFVPTLMTASAVFLGLGMTRLDRAISSSEWNVIAFLDSGQPEGARAVLTTVAASSLSVVTLTFSLTIVTLTLASSSFGSRLVYSFMRDRTSQLMLGVFVGTFAYCLVALRSVRSVEDATFVPHLSVALALGLALFGMGVLVYFIHHVAESIQASNVVYNVRKELEELIRSHLPERGDAANRPESPLESEAFAPERFPHSLLAEKDGIVQAIDDRHLCKLAASLGGCFLLTTRAGDYVVAGTPVAQYRGERELDDDETESALGAFVTGRRRTLVQDVELGFLHLVEIAVRALSPGVNDPFTAIACLDEIGAALALVMERTEPARQVRDSDGELRVLRREVSFSELTRSSFRQIRQHGAADATVMGHLIDVIARIAPLARGREHVEALRREADLCHEVASSRALTDDDRADLRQRYRRACEALTVPA